MTAVGLLAPALRTEARRGFAPWAGLTVLLTLGVLLAASADRWQGGWAETAAELHNAVLITLPAAAAAGCWQGGRERRRGTEELWGTVVRPPLSRFLVSALPVALWVAAGYAVAAGLALLATWPYAQGALGDGPRLALVPADAFVSGAAAAAGQVAGRLVPARLTAPLLAMAGYVGLGLTATARDGAWRFLNPAFSILDTWVPVWWQPAAMAVWAGGLAGAAVLGYAARRRWTGLLPLAAAAAAGALLAQTADGLWHDDPLGRRQVCDTSVTPAVCVNARFADALPQVGAALAGVTGKLAGVRNLPVRWEDRDGEPGRDEASLPSLTPLGWSFVRGRLTDPGEFAWEAVAALEQRGDCPDDRVGVADDAVENYLAPSPSQRSFDDRDAGSDARHRAELATRRAARAHLLAMGEQERRAWLSAYFAARADCYPSGVPTL
ncbi:MAG: hypothetical protein JF597_10835 [Streptomyces sp.]|jgi:hypothetical protein|uniref:hypothetical protein n=1 Tax=Streptomyces sp. TaxID=1931 RepID=UPI0025D95C48|nr:hypothetical protein [Streptomyces sp.]MBW8794062.1 hypothetical protein [Streptomyces sp.]